jgi:hypothetical protein
MGLFGIPAVRIVGDHGVDSGIGRLERLRREAWEALTGTSVTAPTQAQTPFELIGAALRAQDPLLVELVAHRIGERLHRPGAVDRIPVQVDQRVELVESEASVALQERKAGRAQGSPDQQGRIGLRGWWGWLVVAGWTAAVAPLGSGPEPIARHTERLDDLEAAGRKPLEIVVEEP